MADFVCVICKEHPVYATCTCGNGVCEECGHTKTVNAGTFRAKDVWECSECEFGMLRDEPEADQQGSEGE